MRIALATAPVRHGDVAHNLSQMAKYISMAKEQGADLVCFGEAYLQGFDALNWNYEEDRTMAVSCTSPLFQIIAGWTKDSGVDLLFGFLERDGQELYSSCALMGQGKLLFKYRRVSQGWKSATADHHYRQGMEIPVFSYKGKTCAVALCGDLWEHPEQFHLGEDLLFWPVYVDYSEEQWQTAQTEYAEQAQKVCSDVLMINALDRNARGGSCHFCNGEVTAMQPLGEEGLLIVET